MPDDLLTVYVSIGNSDDKLTQARWSCFHDQVAFACRARACQVYGDWLSLPNTPYQNACLAFAIAPADAEVLKKTLRDLAADYGQDSIAWAEARTEFLTPTGLDKVAAAVRRARGGPPPVQVRGYA